MKERIRIVTFLSLITFILICIITGVYFLTQGEYKPALACFGLKLFALFGLNLFSAAMEDNDSSY